MNPALHNLLADVRQHERLASADARRRRILDARLLRAAPAAEPADVPAALVGRRAPRWWAALEAGRLAPDVRPAVEATREPERTGC